MGDQCSFRHNDERAKPTPKAVPSSEPPAQKGTEALQGSSNDSRAKTPWKVFALNRLVMVGILPNVKSTNLNRVVTSPKSARLHRKVESQPIKKPKKGRHQNVLAILKNVRQLGCVFQDTEPPESSSISSGLLDNSRSTHADTSPGMSQRQGVSQREDPELGLAIAQLGIFKDVRFYPILNFGLFWAPLFSRCFYPIMNFGHFWAPSPSSRYPCFTPPDFFVNFGPTALFQLLEALFWPKRRPKILNFYPTRNFGHFWAALSKMSLIFSKFLGRLRRHTQCPLSLVSSSVLLPCSLAIFSLSQRCLGV